MATDVDDLLTMVVEEDLGVVPHARRAPTNVAAPLLSARTLEAAGKGAAAAASHLARAAAVGGHERLPMMRFEDADPRDGLAEEEVEGLPLEVAKDVLESIEEHEVEAAAAGEREDSGDEEDMMPEYTANDFAAASWTDENGYVHCDIAPWVGAPPLAIGRITSFPKTLPHEQRLHYARCYRHPNYRTRLRRVAILSEACLLE